MGPVITVAENIASNAHLAMRQVKKVIHEGMQMDVHSAHRYEVEA